MGIFDKEKKVSREELKSAFRKDSGFIRGGEGRYNRVEREKMAKETFGPKYGSSISKLDFQRELRSLRNEKSRATSIEEKEKIDDKIRYLEQMGGRGI